MHNAAFREQGLDLVYLALPTPPAELRRVVDTLGTVGAIGANVTVPHKQAVLDRCDHLTVEADLVGAVNTLAWTTDGLIGDNTDAVGLSQVLTEDVGLVASDTALVFGTGGAARAAVVALGRTGCPVTVIGRRPDAAQALAELAERAGSPAAEAVDVADDSWVKAAIARSRLVVNATPLGLDGERLPAPFHALGSGHVAYDLIYNPPETPFLVSAREAGAEVHHGLGMLVGQAAAAYRRWTGHEAPTATMSAAALAALSA
jgi:shikimate dehydrogenase